MKDPYVYEGTNILINSANIRDAEKLDDYETTLSRVAIIDIINNPIAISSTKDIFVIHKKLFGEVYSWAGQKRTINIYKEEPVLDGLSVEYSHCKNIDRDLSLIQKEIDKYDWKKADKKTLIQKITKVIASIWQVHAFREGNTRTICMYLYLFMKQLNLKLNVDFIGEHSKYFRNALVLASIGQYSEYEHLEAILMDSISTKRVMGGKEKYQTIKDYDLEKYKYNYHHVKDDD